MARFFRGMGAPLSFKAPEVAQGASIGARDTSMRAPTDDEQKRAAIRTAKAGAYKEAVKTVDAGETAPDAAGMTLNMPAEAQYSEEQYYKNLAQLGYPDFAQEEQKRAEEVRQAEIVTANKGLDQQLRVGEVTVAMTLAGDPRGAFVTYNRFAEKGMRAIEPPRVIDADTIFLKTEDNPEGAPYKRSELARMQADAGKRMDTWLPVVTKRIGKSEVGFQRHALTGEEKKVYDVDFAVADAKVAEKASPLRQQYLHDKRTQDYLMRGTQYTTLLAANRAGEASTDKRGVSDIALVFSYMRLLDPQSTVRESEADSVRNATGIPEKVRTMALKVMQGDGLSDSQRSEILNTSAAVFGSSKTIHDTGVRPMFDEYAKNIGVPANTVTGNPNFETTIAEYENGKKAKKGEPGYPKAEVVEVEGKATADGKVPIFDKNTKTFIRYK